MALQDDEKFIPKFLKPARFARLIDCSRARVYTMIADRTVRSIRLSEGGGIRIPASELERLATLATAGEEVE